MIAGVKPLAVGGVAPEFTLETGDGAPVSLGDYRDRQAVVLFFPVSFT